MSKPITYTVTYIHKIECDSDKYKIVCMLKL